MAWVGLGSGFVEIMEDGEGRGERGAVRVGDVDVHCRGEHCGTVRN